MDTKSLLDVCLVSMGGATGALLRHFTSLYFNREGASIPMGTLAVNLVGCFLIGLLHGWGLTAGQSRTRTFFATGFLGAFTTMSAFSIETWGMAENGNRVAAFVYVAVSIIGCIACAALGVTLARWASGDVVAVGAGE